ncbi:hypothetical protein BGX38DRAFT_1276549 [Terfezia claveryi]|nr:hypothetical protein BGX38DRAFT_1276549 [Terfezia claveryi]
MEEILAPLVTIFEAGGSDMACGDKNAANDNDAFVTSPYPLFSTLIRLMQKNSLTDLNVKPIQNSLWSLPKILDTYVRDHAFKLLELNLYVWDKEVKFDYDIKALVISMRKNTKGAVKNEDYLKFTGQQQVWNAPPEPLSILTIALQIPHLVGRFRDYLQLSSDWFWYQCNNFKEMVYKSIMCAGQGIKTSEDREM